MVQQGRHPQKERTLKKYKVLQQSDVDENDLSLEDTLNQLASLGWVVVTAVYSDATGCRIILEKDATS
jgi:hypothetical protein